MANLTLKGNAVQTSGELAKAGDTCEDFAFVKADLSEGKLSELNDKYIVLNIFPSIDTGTCAMSVRQFNKMASELKDTRVLCISKDLPFAQKRFCGAEGIDKVETVSVFRNDFSQKYQLEILDGPLKGLCSRCVLVLDENKKVIYSEQVNEITEEPKYEAALSVIKN